MAPVTNPKMAQQRPRAAPDSARFRLRVCRIFQGYAKGQICAATIVVRHICTAESHQECLFDALPAGHLHFSSVLTKSIFNKTSPDGRCSLFEHTSRFAHAAPPTPLSAPSGPLPPFPLNPERGLFHCTAPGSITFSVPTSSPSPNTSPPLPAFPPRACLGGSTGRGGAHATRCSLPARAIRMRLPQPACLSCLSRAI